jgi:putative heme degradation protein
MTSWLVEYGDFGGGLHAGRHTNEDRAKLQAKEYLGYLIDHLKLHADSEAHVGRNKEYVKEARKLIQDIHYLIDNNMIWAAYLDFKAFENKWNHHFHPFPLQMAIGSMRVIPTPEAEVYAS